MIVNIIGDVYRSILIFTAFVIFHFWAFLAIFGQFWHFWGFSGDLGGLGALVSYEVTIWIRLVVARVHIGLGGSRVFFGEVWRGPEGVCYTPIRNFLPLYKSCMAPDFVPNTT